MSGKPTQRFGRGAEAHAEVREGSVGPSEGSGGPAWGLEGYTKKTWLDYSLLGLCT